MKILISAAEASSDAHGAELLRALQAKTSVDAFGVGGPKLQEAGLRAVVDARDLLAMGFSEIIGRLPKIFGSLRALTRAAENEKPDIIVVIDYPDFHFRLARRLQKLSIPMVYFIPPKVWVWRKKRIQVLKRLFTRILCIFPFEEDFYRAENVPAVYVGNPLVDELPMELTREQARARLKLRSEAKVLVVMAGSRPSELQRHVPLMLEAASMTARRMRRTGILGRTEKLHVLMPLPLTASRASAEDEVLHQARPGGRWEELDLWISQGNSAEALVAADAGLIKSGTSTLEAALLGCPHAVVYQPNWLSSWIFKRIIRYSGPVGLVNLVNGWKPGDEMIAREILCEDATPENLADEAVSLLTNPEKRERMLAKLRGVRERILKQKNPSIRAAEEILQIVSTKEGKPHQP